MRNHSAELIALAQYLAGEFDNREQALADPAWYVHLRLWQIPIPNFFDEGITLFAEQANILNIDRPYRPRIMQLYQTESNTLKVQYYLIPDLQGVQGAGSRPELLAKLTNKGVELLPSCLLTVTYQILDPNAYQFKANLPPGQLCQFTYQGETFTVDLGFEVNQRELLSYDKGTNPMTGQPIWGALLGPFRFIKRLDLATKIEN
jgi:hypothetical protein